MKSAVILAKSPGFYVPYTGYLKSLGLPIQESERSIKLCTVDRQYFMFYDRDISGFYEKYEAPKSAIKSGYQYAYLVECRSEELFCKIIGGSPHIHEFIVCDSNGKIHTPVDISTSRLSL